MALRCHGGGPAGQKGQGALEGPSLFSIAGETARDVGGLTEPLVHSRPSPSLREALSPLCWGCRFSEGSARGGRTSCTHPERGCGACLRCRGRCPRSQHPAGEGQAGGLWASQVRREQAGEGTVISTRCGRHTQAPSRASNSRQDTGLEPTGEETPVTSLGRQVPGGGSALPSGTSHVSLPTRLFQVPGKGPDSRFQVWPPSPHLGPQPRALGPQPPTWFQPQGRLIQGILS